MRMKLFSVPFACASCRKARTHTKWLLHPSIPLDIRQLAATVAAMGGLYFYMAQASGSWNQKRT